MNKAFFTCKNCGEKFYKENSIKVKRGYKCVAACPKCNSLENFYTITFRLSDFDSEITTELEPLTETKSEPKFKAGDRVFNKVTHKWVNIIEFDIETGLYVVRYDDGIKGRSLESELRFMEEETIEGCVESIEDRLKELRKMCTINLTDSNYTDKVEVLLNGYKYVEEDGKAYFVKKKKEYPKTFEECVHVLEGENRMSLEQMNTFRKLIDARNAYWKIAGEEMGLGKPWEPDWRKERYIIYRNQYDIIGGYREAGCAEHHIFEFPSPVMRDDFEENFKSEIEICKELL